MTRIRLTMVLLTVLGRQACAQDFHLDGFIDTRLAAASSDRSFTDGGYGKLQDGGTRGGSPSLQANLDQISLIGTALLTEDILTYAQIRYDPTQRTAIDLIEAFMRYRPVSTSRWRWAVKGGAFFPPISLENTGPGWTSAWTLTPSAINSWVGEELRTVGGESKIEWRGDEDRIDLTAALFIDNDPAGILLANRGWAMTDHVTGLFDQTRLPDTGNPLQGPQTQRHVGLFQEIDDHPGWYAGLHWNNDGWGSAQLLRYDNQADPSAIRRGQYAWKTDFWSLGAQTAIGNLTLLSQGMAGTTEVDPRATLHLIAQFQSAYLLAGYDIADWRLAARVDVFGTQVQASGVNNHQGEHGSAWTLALTWRPLPYLRITGEGIRTDSWRVQRLAVNQPAAETDTLMQLGVRVSF